MDELRKNKIDSLRRKYSDTDSLGMIDNLETGVRQLLEEKKMAENPLFVAIFKDADKRLEDINILLQTDPKLTDLERRVLFEAKKIWTFVFDRFGMVPHDRALEMLDSRIEELTKR